MGTVILERYFQNILYYLNKIYIFSDCLYIELNNTFCNILVRRYFEKNDIRQMLIIKNNIQFNFYNFLEIFNNKIMFSIKL